MLELTPREIYHELNKYIIGQDKAKRAVAIALRNRWRRSKITDELKNEITPKNILLVGPTGVGKTEIARRIAKLTNAPFIKVEATKFTEVGYVGKEVDSIIRELTDKAIQIEKNNRLIKNNTKARKLAEERIIDILVSNINKEKTQHEDQQASNEDQQASNEDLQASKQVLRQQLQEGLLDEQIIEIKFTDHSPTLEVMTLPGMPGMDGMDDVNNSLQMIFSNAIKNIANNKNKRMIMNKMKIKDALKFLIEEESAKCLNMDQIKREAIEQVEQHGIVFIDEIDKLCRHKKSIMNNADISGEGVQRDLLPLLEGSNINTKYGLVKTDHILFIAAGAFHYNNPSDLIPELQGRLPIQVQLDALTKKDFVNILSSTKTSLLLQYQALFKPEDFNLIFTKDSIKRIAEIAWHINEYTDNIGARRLHTILEILLENISFSSSKGNIVNITIDKNYVNKQLKHLVNYDKLNKYII